ncbi:Adaptin N terminal region family protein [Trichomonas vaginalis G3]|uniref:AP-3 complex subunit delta n=1 Tax=Trichomonas vaginalis (strain ATCC PRA-98 / G3) TaxID=412133 RepID=A2FCR4_TRIV3|nr:delta adaptin-related family [Trichomonas vaginalis G3]EAX97288.1 Adaptin N terminal region family protein [Trichomonas vaginalis G3]KAI5518190.1 delta adaptin-related family [Trichomonas vaginalis G3]|eukprot:XP_001310218.1 Adaptin N terminal region family protein [Trichomonas vaginalis G3]
MNFNLAERSQEYYRAVFEGKQTEYITEMLQKIQAELRSQSTLAKIESIPQLIFINFLGYDTSWADFDLLDVMSIENSFSTKRVSYTAASAMWNCDSNVIVLAPNRISKDITSPNSFTATAVLNSISSFMTETIAQLIAGDVISLMKSQRLPLKQKAIATFYRICLKYQPALKIGIQTLRGALDDPNPSTVRIVLGVFCEFSAHNPQPFVPLIPKFFGMLATCYDNLSQIRLIKILSYLCTVEPRLPKKLIQPFTDLINSTSSHSVLFECIDAVINIPISNSALISNATSRVESFIYNSNPNMRYLALQQFMKLIRLNPRLITDHREIIGECINHDDDSIRLTAIDLISSLATAKTLDNVVGRIYEQLRDPKRPSTKDQLAEKIIEICSRDDYEMISDFEWYIAVLMDISDDPQISCFDLLSEQFLDLAERVPSIRRRIVHEMSRIIENPRFFSADNLLLVASYIIGEFSDDYSLFSSILQPVIINDSARVQACCLAASLKLYLRASESERLELDSLYQLKLPLFASSQYTDVSEKAETLIKLLEIINNSDRKISLLENFCKKLYVFHNDEEEEIDEIPDRPPALDEPVTLFTEETEEDIAYLSGKSKIKKSNRRRKHRKNKNKKQVQDFEINFDQSEDSNEDDEDDEEFDAFEDRPTTSMKASRRKLQQGQEGQLVGQNNSLIVRATDIIISSARPNLVEIELLVTNCARTNFESVEIQVPQSANVKQVVVKPIGQMPQGSSIFHHIMLEIAIINNPQSIRIMLIPSNGGETLEGRIRLVPSNFLLPGDSALLSIAQNESVFISNVSISSNSKPKTVLNALSTMLRANIIRGNDPTSRILFSRTTTGLNVISILKINQGIVEVTVKSSDNNMANSISREIEMKIRSLMA